MLWMVTWRSYRPLKAATHRNRGTIYQVYLTCARHYITRKRRMYGVVCSRLGVYFTLSWQSLVINSPTPFSGDNRAVILVRARLNRAVPTLCWIWSLLVFLSRNWLTGLYTHTQYFQWFYLEKKKGCRLRPETQLSRWTQLSRCFFDRW